MTLDWYGISWALAIIVARSQQQAAKNATYEGLTFNDRMQSGTKRPELRKRFSTEQRHRPVPRSGGDRAARLAAGCQRDRLNDKGQDPGDQVRGWSPWPARVDPNRFVTWRPGPKGLGRYVFTQSF